MNELALIAGTYIALGIISFLYQGVKDSFYSKHLPWYLNVGLSALFIFTWFLDLNKAAYTYNTSNSANLEDALDKLNEVQDK